MVLRFRCSLLLAVVMAFDSTTGSRQDESKQPKIVLNLKKPVADHQVRFGLSCDHQVEGQYRTLDRPASIVELMGAPIDVVTIRGCGRRWKTVDVVQKCVLRLLETKTRTVYRYEPWAEGVYADVVATLQFSDKVEGTLEESGGHVCFTNHSKSARWVRVQPIE